MASLALEKQQIEAELEDPKLTPFHLTGGRLRVMCVFFFKEKGADLW